MRTGIIFIIPVMFASVPIVASASTIRIVAKSPGNSPFLLGKTTRRKDRLQEQNRQRRQSELDGTGLPLPFAGFGGYGPCIEEIAPAVDCRIAVEHFTIPAGTGYTDATVMAQYGGEVRRHYDEFIRVCGTPDK